MNPAPQNSHNAPEWFTRALAQPGDSRFVEVDGLRMHLLTWRWDETDLPPLLLVHGMMCQAHWWDAIAPFLAQGHRVAAMEFSGMGESGRRPAYDADVFTRDVLGVVHALGLAPATVIGHSYGGSRALMAARLDPSAFKRIIAIDSYFHMPETEGPLGMPPAAQARVMPDRASLRSRYRLTPPQPVWLPFMLDHVAEHSLRQTPEGWTWHFDHRVGILEEADGLERLKDVQAQVDFIACEHSALLTADAARRVVAAMPHGRGPIVLPDAHHHAMLDQPLALIAALRALLA